MSVNTESTRWGSTVAQFDAIASVCRGLFLAKLDDYGPSWYLFRVPSVVDQIFIKARRIRQLEELGGEGQVPDGPADEYLGIINYCAIALDKVLHGDADSRGAIPTEPPARWRDETSAGETFDRVMAKAREVLLRKNHDYGEAWRDMAIASITDEILVRTARLKHMLRNGTAPRVSEGAEAQLWDTINYSVFALIKLGFPSGQK